MLAQSLTPTHPRHPFAFREPHYPTPMILAWMQALQIPIDPSFDSLQPPFFSAPSCYELRLTNSKNKPISNSWITQFYRIMDRPLPSSCIASPDSPSPRSIRETMLLRLQSTQSSDALSFQSPDPDSTLPPLLSSVNILDFMMIASRKDLVNLIDEHRTRCLLHTLSLNPIHPHYHFLPPNPPFLKTLLQHHLRIRHLLTSCDWNAPSNLAHGAPDFMRTLAQKDDFFVSSFLHPSSLNPHEIKAWNELWSDLDLLLLHYIQNLFAESLQHAISLRRQYQTHGRDTVVHLTHEPHFLSLLYTQLDPLFPSHYDGTPTSFRRDALDSLILKALEAFVLNLESLHHTQKLSQDSFQNALSCLTSIFLHSSSQNLTPPFQFQALELCQQSWRRHSSTLSEPLISPLDVYSHFTVPKLGDWIIYQHDHTPSCHQAQLLKDWGQWLYRMGQPTSFGFRIMEGYPTNTAPPQWIWNPCVVFETPRSPPIPPSPSHSQRLSLFDAFALNPSPILHTIATHALEQGAQFSPYWPSWSSLIHQSPPPQWIASCLHGLTPPIWNKTQPSSFSPSHSFPLFPSLAVNFESQYALVTSRCLQLEMLSQFVPSQNPSLINPSPKRL